MPGRSRRSETYATTSALRQEGMNSFDAALVIWRRAPVAIVSTQMS